MTKAGTKGVPRAEREQQILDAACDEIGRNGYVGMSLAAVAAKTGISKPMVLAYFGTKERLYIACVERAGNKVGDHIESAMTAAPPTLAMPRAVLHAIFTALSTRPVDWLVIWDQTVPGDSEALAAARVVRSRLAALAGQGVAAVGGAGPLGPLPEREDLAVLTQGWMGMVGAIINWWIRHPEQTAEEMAERATRAFAVIASAGVSEADVVAGPVASPLPGTLVRGSESGRPLMAAFDLFGRRWAILTVWELRTGTMTFTQLKEAMGDVSAGVLSARLKELTAARIVRSRDGRYSLTKIGKSLLVAIAPLELWTRAWSAAVGRPHD